DPVVAEIPSAAPVAIAAGGPGRLRSVYVVGLLPETVAVALNVPVTLSAVIAGALARPALFVVAVAWVVPSGKLAPALFGALPIVNVTETPATGSPPAPRTCTVSVRS